jgi:4-hydroxybutyrate CoA-transferase
MPRELTPAQVPDLLKPGMTVFLAGSATEPSSLIAALAARPDASRGVRYTGVLVPGVNRVDPVAWHPAARGTMFFITPDMRATFEAGRTELIPLQYCENYAYLRDRMPIDLALVGVAPPDASGRCSPGICNDFLPLLLERGVPIVAELNPQIPRTLGAPAAPLDSFAYTVAVDHSLIEQTAGALGPDFLAIGRHVAGLIRDGDCVQIGIGKVPAAVLNALKDHKRLGMHTGMIVDEVMMLAEAGVLTGEHKPIDKGEIVTGFALGSRALYDWCARRRDLRFEPVGYTHDVRRIAQLDRFMSINSAIEVDLFGQTNAEHVDGRQISGIGGSVDFVRGARMSNGGRSIMALGATAGGGKVSRIVGGLRADTPTTCLRSDTDTVVTEYGVAELRYKPIDARAEALIAVAAPQFRDRLADEWAAFRRCKS